MKKATVIDWGKFQEWLLVSLLAAIIALLSACGGGGGGTPAAGMTTSGVTSGEIEGFGSIIVNGVKFEVEGAEVEIEHGVTTIISSATQTEHLNEGMQVEVEVEFNDDGSTGTASFVSRNPSLEGTISGLSGAGDIRTFTLLGQTVIAMTGVTRFDNSNPLASLADLATAESSGWVLEVHGLPDGNGNIQATYIEQKADSVSAFLAAGGLFELTGEVLTSDTTTITLSNGAVVEYDGNTLFDPSLAAVQPGRMIEAKWDADPGLNPAVIVEVKGQFGDNLGKVEIEGLIRALDTAANRFMLNGTTVSYDENSTLFYGVSDPNNPEADMWDGIKVEAEGPMNGGVLQATKIKFKDSFRYEGLATDNTTELTLSVPAPAGGTLTLLLDSAITDEEVGIDYSQPVKLRARIAAGTTLIATRVENGGNNDRQIFEAPVVAFSEVNDRVEMLDADGNPATAGGAIVVDTSAMAENLPFNSGEDSDYQIEDSEVTRATFYSTLRVGDRAKARYRSGWDEIEIELEDD